MPRPALHGTDDLLDAARELILDTGPRSVGIRDIAVRSGAPSGSLYHRFRSRDNLVALAWLRAVRRFQDGFVTVLETPEPREAVRGALRWSVEFALASPGDTRLLVCYSQPDLLDSTPSAEILAELAPVNDALERALMALARRLFGSARAAAVERTTHAVIDLPYAALRRHVLAGTLSRRTAGTLEAAALAIVDHEEGP
jgi:AcrR family transcriptional regulator